jgi:coproporphyrinogen III oxidase-like Fe-S oxidoreductase
VEFQRERAEQYFAALRKEITLLSDAGYRFGEMYIGGGTPTVMPGELAATIDLVSARHPVRAISVETNPHDLDPANMRRLRDAGVSRLSVGVQSFDDRLLSEMQRLEKYGNGAEIRDHLEEVMGIFDTLNVDMIFNFPHQTEAALRNDLEVLSSQLSVDQVSFYPLMSTSSTARPMRREMGEVDFARERHFYQQIAAHMLDAGYLRSSAWCFSRKPGMFDEYIVEHEEYLGLGSGAFSYLSGQLYANTFSINHYQRMLAADNPSVVRTRSLSEKEQMRYHLLMQLFSGQIEKKSADNRFGGRFQHVLQTDLAALKLIGAIEDSAQQIRLTESGYYLWVVLMREFFTGVNNFRDEMRHHMTTERTAFGNPR